ncbi:type II toxin-antitoxin system PemK/MazF family toxin [Paenarthrobacter sp. NCHU4564]|uniref:type II toxin-antitoxin system PemK/MazF family toxin n=1 Tax=Paenarthrobacter sp. NCHU4564 TaxID=3451353 RepID=UPI003F9A355F
MAFDLRPLGRLVLRSLKALGAGSKPGTPAPSAQRHGRAPGAGKQSIAYPGDFTGTARMNYAPKPDGQPDPGEIVWSWVPYEEDHSRGKDRPVLVVGRDGGWLLGLMLTSKDHDNGYRAGDYVDIGSGPWDRQGRPSEVKLDRVIRLDPQTVRREGAVLGQSRFNAVSKAMKERHQWN